MAVALVQSATSNATGSGAPSATLGATPTVGNYILGVESFATFVSDGTLHDSASHNATLIARSTTGNAGGSTWKFAVVSGTTATWSATLGGDEGSIVVLEFSGQDSTTPIDNTPTWSASTANGTSRATPSVTPTVANCDAVAIVTTDSASVTFPATLTGGWTLANKATGSGHFHGSAVYTKTITDTSATSVTITWTGDSTNSAATLILLRPASGGGSSLTSTITDGAGLVDAASTAQGFGLTVTDGAGSTDSRSTSAAFAQTVTDSTGLVDTRSVAAAFTTSITDPAGLADSDTTAEVLAVTITDSAGITDGLTTGGGSTLTAAISDTAGLTDAASTAATLAVTLSDTAGTVDAAFSAAGIAVSLTDSLPTVDSVATAAAWALSTTDSAGSLDVLSAIPGGLVERTKVGSADAASTVLRSGSRATGPRSTSAATQGLSGGSS